jgi:hypothetical protein
MKILKTPIKPKKTTWVGFFEKTRVFANPELTCPLLTVK